MLCGFQQRLFGVRLLQKLVSWVELFQKLRCARGLVIETPQSFPQYFELCLVVTLEYGWVVLAQRLGHKVFHDSARVQSARKRMMQLVD